LEEVEKNRRQKLCEIYQISGKAIFGSLSAAIQGVISEESMLLTTKGMLQKLRGDLLTADVKGPAMPRLLDFESVVDQLNEIDAKTTQFCEQSSTLYIPKIMSAIEDRLKVECVRLKQVLSNLNVLGEQVAAETLFTSKNHLVETFNRLLEESRQLFPKDQFISTFPKAQPDFWHLETQRVLLVSIGSLKTRIEGHVGQCNKG
jgi:hypothetical protein